MTSLSLIAVIALSLLILQAFFLRLGASRLKGKGITFARATGIVVAHTLAAIALLPVFVWLEEAMPGSLVPAVGQLVATLLLTWIIIKRLARCTFGQAIRCWLWTLIPMAAYVAFILWVSRPYLLELFVASDPSMAPTILDEHLEGNCPVCGKTATVSNRLAQWSHSRREPLPAICGSCLQSSEIRERGDQVKPADRFAASKMIRPRRWDLIVVRTKNEPAQLHLRRLVGLPGEVVAIREGGIWINDTRMGPPAEIARLKWVADTLNPDEEADQAGTSPVRLNDDEYYVLGDNSRDSVDSRHWGPLPGKNITGVVDLIYWPPGRMRRLR